MHSNESLFRILKCVYKQFGANWAVSLIMFSCDLWVMGRM